MFVEGKLRTRSIRMWQRRIKFRAKTADANRNAAKNLRECITK